MSFLEDEDDFEASKPSRSNKSNVFVDLSSDSSSDLDDEEDEEEKLKQNALLLSDDDEDDDDDDLLSSSSGEQTAKGWGKNKFQFYQNEDEASSSSDERLEEEEALRIQSKKLAQMDEEDFMSIPGASKKMGDKKKKKKEKGEKRKVDDSEVFVVKQTEASPELEALLADMKEKAKEVRDVLNPLLERVRRGDIVTSEGISFLELRNHLLLNYCLNLNFYLLLKAEGRPVEDHPVVEELVRLRLMIEKTKPIDEKLRPQISRLLKTASLGLDAVAKDPSMMRANPSRMVVAKKKSRIVEEDGEEEEEMGGDEVNEFYQPPKASALFFEEDERKAAKKERREKRLRERAAKSNIMTMVREEFDEGPEERSTQLSVLQRQVDSVADAEQKDIAKFEQERFIRLRPTKADKKRQRKESQFADELQDLDDFGEVEKMLKSARVRQGEFPGGQGPLNEMARKLREAQGEGMEDLDDDQDIGDVRIKKRDLEAEQAYEEFLAEAKAKRDEAKKKKYADNPNARRKNVVEVELGDDDDESKRSISYAMEANKGLRQRKKQDIARVRNKKKFGKAEKKRSGMVKKVVKEDKRYEGERTGINANVIRSTKLR